MGEVEAKEVEAVAAVAAVVVVEACRAWHAPWHVLRSGWERW